MRLRSHSRRAAAKAPCTSLPLSASSSSEKSSGSVCDPEEESDSASECSQDSSSSEFLDNDNEPCCREVRDYLDYVEEGGYVPFREYCQRFGILEDYFRDFDSVA